MPNGRQGDHPLRDIAVYGTVYFDAETNARIKRLVDADGPLLPLLSEVAVCWPRPSGGNWGSVTDPESFARVVREIERLDQKLGESDSRDQS